MARKIRRGRRANDPPLWVIYGLLLLPVGFLLTFNYVPALSAFYHAFTSWDVGADTGWEGFPALKDALASPGLVVTSLRSLVEAERSHWVGLGNFGELFRDPVFLQSCWNLLRLGLFAFTVNITVPFAISEMIYHLKSERLSYLCRVAVVVPMVVPGVVMFMLWGYIYSDAGILTEFLTAVGLHHWVRGWLSDPNTALWAVAFVGFPFANGFAILVYYAGLSNIPPSVLEAADLDGLGKGGQILRIHIPLVLAQFRLIMVVTVIAVVNGFELVYILTQDGGPGYETMVPGLYMFFNGFTYQRMGYACALGLLMLTFLLTFTMLLNRFVRTEEYDPAAR